MKIIYSENSCKEISSHLNIPFRVIKELLENDLLVPDSVLSIEDTAALQRYSQKQEEIEKNKPEKLLFKKRLREIQKKKKRYKKRSKSVNPWSKNTSKSDKIRLINVPMGGKIK